MTIILASDILQKNVMSKVGLCSKRLENNTGFWSSWRLWLFLGQPTIMLNSVCSQPDAWESMNRSSRDTVSSKHSQNKSQICFYSLLSYLYPFTTILSEALFIFHFFHVIPINQILRAINSTSTVNILFHSGFHQPALGLSKRFLVSLPLVSPMSF